jgi:hypothetical protein
LAHMRGRLRAVVVGEALKEKAAEIEERERRD